MGIKLIVFLLGIIDLSLLVFLYHYYKEFYKKGLDNIETTINRLRDKVISNNNIEEKINIVKDSEQTTIKVKEKVKFEDAFNKLSEEQKNFYEEVVNYATSFENVNTFSYDYDKRIRVGQRKTLAIISIKNDCLVVKLKMGSLKVSEDLEPLQLKPVKIVIKTIEDVAEAKNQIAMAYSKQTGAINISVKGDSEDE